MSEQSAEEEGFDVEVRNDIDEAEDAFNSSGAGAVIPIRDPADEPYVFRFEVGPAILTQLLIKLRKIEVRPLLDSLHARHPGFYQLFLDGRAVYIGKAQRPIGMRLREHIRTLRGKVALGRMGCKFAYVEDPSLVNVAEGALIGFFDSLEEADWNTTGFGSKVTGFGRAGTKGANWGELFPVDLELQIEVRPKGTKALMLDGLIRLINLGAPITFTIPSKYRGSFRESHPEPLTLNVKTLPFSTWVKFVEKHLGDYWTIRREPRSWYVVPKD